MDRKKELKAQYKLMKPQMGIYIIRSKTTNQYFLEATKNLKGTMNGSLFKLQMGGHPNRELNKAWKEQGQESFTVEILEYLEYEEEESKTDYNEELKLMEMIWTEKFDKEKLVHYKR